MLYSHVGLSDFNGHVWNADGAPPRPALLYEYPPMDLQGATTDKKYWEKVTQIAAWDPARCQDSLAKTKTYAAGANVAWIQAFALGSPIPAATLPWCQLCDLADKFFQEDSDRSYVLIDGRILFPFTLEAFTELVPAAGPAPPTLQDGTLLLLGGHAVVQAWWLSMARALVAPDYGKVAALWHGGLSVPVRLYEPMDSRPRLLSHAIGYVEALRLYDKALGDNFLTFSDKLAATGLRMDGKSLARFQDPRARLGGSHVGLAWCLGLGCVKCAVLQPGPGHLVQGRRHQQGHAASCSRGSHAA